MAGVSIRLGAGAALALGAAGPLFESLAERAWEELRPDARQRATRVLSTAAEEIGCDDEQLGELICSSETSRLQTGLAMDAAQRTAWPPKVYALGRVLAAGLIATDEDKVNVQDQALVAMADLERLHLILLELLVKYEPEWKYDHIEATLHRLPSYQDVFLAGGRPGDPKVWSIGRRKWPDHRIVAVRSQLRPVLTSLLGTLQRHGLAAENDQTSGALENFSKDLVQQVNRQGGQVQRRGQARPVTLRETTVRSAGPSWSPTELGEMILDYYRLAGEEEIRDALGPGQPAGLSLDAAERESVGRRVRPTSFAATRPWPAHGRQALTEAHPHLRRQFADIGVGRERQATAGLNGRPGSAPPGRGGLGRLRDVPRSRLASRPPPRPGCGLPPSTVRGASRPAAR